MSSSESLKSTLSVYMRQAGAWDVGFADPSAGFQHVLPDYHPQKVWPDCRSVVVFAVPMSPEMNNTYVGPLAPWPERTLPSPVPDNIISEHYALNRVARLSSNYVQMVCMAILESEGYRSSFRRIQYKTAAYEAGLGVYGKSGLIIHPELGSRLCLGVVMTDAAIEHDTPLRDFHPCEGCDECMKNCPAEAYDPQLDYPESWSRETCVARRAEIDENGLYCNNCMASCPAGSIPDSVIYQVSTARSLI
ncbi:MAG: epoxyqueuosine reductase [Candidatus Fermentibacteraceae bacterium]|nr:epoxyqueuosine reductase [Candidatus Fermentibacteraceae bacterium]MBN2608310.1 epoxyqueuosine reductase [Candidatus Fermentibacteraceae bacterium]